VPRDLAVTFAEQSDELDREIAMRRKVYRTWIDSGRMKQADAEARMARLLAARDTFKALAQYRNALPPPLFSMRTVHVDL
jgi:hypothetical protein